MKPLHLPLEGHDLLAVERFKDDTVSIFCFGLKAVYRRPL